MINICPILSAALYLSPQRISSTLFARNIEINSEYFSIVNKINILFFLAYDIFMKFLVRYARFQSYFLEKYKNCVNDVINCTMSNPKIINGLLCILTLMKDADA